MTNYDFCSTPVKAIQGDIKIPGDKSISHRAIMLGALSHGISTINGFLTSEDCLATMRAFQSMGVDIKQDSTNVVIRGVGKRGLLTPAGKIDCGNSGTTMRLMAGILAAQPFDSQLTGDESLLKRPMKRIATPLAKMGADIQTCEGKPPVVIKGNKLLRRIHYEIPEVSAQVKSCILFAGMYANGVTSVVESGITRDHTERMLKTFGYPIQRNNNTIEINGDGDGVGTEINVPGDISSAAFFIVAATIIPEAKLMLRDVGINQTRDGVIRVLKQMGANIQILNRRNFGEEPVADLLVTHAPLKGTHINEALVSLSIDEMPVIMIAAACAKGQTTIEGAKELRCKESDRLDAMITGLQNLGIDAQILADGALIQGGTIHGGMIESYHDHRIAMAFSVAGAVAESPVYIKNCQNVSTSFPTFIELAQQVWLDVAVNHN